MKKTKLFSQELVWTAAGMLDAEMIRSLLESFGIKAALLQESAGAAYGINFGPLGDVDVYVPQEMADKAKEILADYQSGKLDKDSTAS
jgi:hypothetical protein